MPTNSILLVDEDSTGLLPLRRCFPEYDSIYASTIDEAVKLLLDESLNIRLVVAEMYLPQNLEDKECISLRREQRRKLFAQLAANEGNEVKIDLITAGLETAFNLIYQVLQKDGALKIITDYFEATKRKKRFPCPILVLTAGENDIALRVMSVIIHSDVPKISKPAGSNIIEPIIRELLDKTP